MIGPIKFETDGDEPLSPSQVAEQLPFRLQLLLGMSAKMPDLKLREAFRSTPFPELCSLVEIGMVEIEPPLTERRKVKLEEVTVTDFGNEVAIACRGLENIPADFKQWMRRQDALSN
ncbi:MAG TPA: hypothetical protein VH234_02065 [Candidatus Saccharimonadales bacterium]|jgi:hypothetical protein|nr:hypothetical protein [Candidatus Saccharimonadales bacterium]